MQSIEQSTDIGEDVIEMKEINTGDKKIRPPGQSLIFGDLFGMKSANKHVNQYTFAERQNWVRGPSQCLVYICKDNIVCLKHIEEINDFYIFSVTKILGVTRLLVHFVLGLINISRSTVDSLLCKGMDKLLCIALYEPRLTLLVTTIEQEIFGQKKLEPSFTELLEQQRQAKKRLAKISTEFANVADSIQSPTLNKQLMYCLFDMIVGELYPELEINFKK